MTQHTLYPSVAAMLEPATLSLIAGQPLSAVTCHALTPEFAKSGSRILLVETEGGQGPRFVLKRVAMAWDWLMRATEDTHCRSVTLWQQGIFDRLPHAIEHGILACARDGEGWALLMRDLGGTLVTNRRFSPAENQLFLRSMAAMHAAFFNDPALHEPALGLCGLPHVYGMFSTHTGRREAGGSDEVPQRILEGWAQLPDLVDHEVAAITLALVEDPAPLCAALKRYPFTLIHGDWRHANQGLLVEQGRSRTVLLDWQLAAVAPPAVELGRYLGANSALLPGSKEESLAYYYGCLAALLGAQATPDWWEPQLALAMLGGFVQDGWAIGLKATHWRVGAEARAHWRADLAWWSAWVRAGARWLGN